VRYELPAGGLESGEHQLRMVASDLVGWSREEQASFSIDFVKEGLGAPHQMRFGAYSLYGMRRPTKS
jgi:hypothetical protein